MMITKMMMTIITLQIMTMTMMIPIIKILQIMTMIIFCDPHLPHDIGWHDGVGASQIPCDPHTVVLGMIIHQLSSQSSP